MPKEPELKARDKVVVRMTREGAVEENLTAGTEPVSYTHLDVYKRQSSSWSIRASSIRRETAISPAKISGSVRLVRRR